MKMKAMASIMASGHPNQSINKWNEENDQYSIIQSVYNQSITSKWQCAIIQSVNQVMVNIFNQSPQCLSIS